MKKYNSPEMKIVLYNNEDVITGSPATDWGVCPYFNDLGDF